MKKLLILLGLLALPAGCRRTEILIGVITDIEAPNSVDTVRLTATRVDTMKEVVRQEWPISGVQNQPFELPGSFGIYSPDGSEPRVQVRVAGLHAGVEVLHRDAVVSLVKQKTLFLRMSLVKRCQAMDCPTGQTCVEGRCQGALVDETTLPEYTTDAEKSVACSSGTAFINTSTKAPVPQLGSDCAPDQQCTEGTCYQLPASLMNVVSGTKIDTFLSDTGETAVAADLSKSTIVAWLPDGHGGYAMQPGRGSADGTFTVPNVAPGPYVLQVDDTYLATHSHVIDLGAVELGRVDGVPAAMPMSYLLNLTGLVPWQPTDILEVYSAGATQFGFDQDDGTGTIFMTGVTTVSHTETISGARNFLPNLLDPARDVLYIGQIASRTVGPLLYQSFAKLLLPSGIRQVDGQTTTVSGMLTDVPMPQTFGADFRATAFAQAAQSINPRAIVFSNAGIDVNTRPGPSGYGLYGATMDLLFATFPMGAQPSDQRVSSSFGTPAPADWGIFVDAEQAMTVQYTLPGAAGPTPPGAISGVVRVDVDVATAQAQPLAPRLTPVSAPSIDGRSFFDDQSVGPTPTLSWSLPSLGKPTDYRIYFNPLVLNKNRQTRRGTTGVVTLLTSDTSITLPPGLLKPGSSYAIRVDAEIVGGVSGARQPLRSDLPYAAASVLSGVITVGGSSSGSDGGLLGTCQ